MREKIMQKVSLVVMLICVFGIFDTNGVRAQRENTKTTESREAEKAWESLIRMKGGRNRLQNISNFLTYLQPGGPVLSQLEVLPNKTWTFIFDFGGNPYLYRGDTSKPIEEWANRDGVTRSEKGDPTDFLSRERVVYLLETKYDKPTPVRISRLKGGRKSYDVLETILRDNRIDFYYDQEEMLVSKIVIYQPSGKVLMTYQFANYTDIGGIKMPQREYLGSEDVSIKHYDGIGFAFNVDYDPELFTRPLIATTSDAWKRKP